jgi:phosphoribosylamine--glycine ligase
LRVLVIGSGGREHALTWKIAQSDKVSKIFAAPGNAGIGEIAERVDIKVTDVKALADFAEKQGVDLTVVGPEASLGAGVADEFEKRSLTIFGPTKEAVQLEVSKVFSKKLMIDYGIPTGTFEAFSDPDKADAYIESIAGKTSNPIPVKADGEAAGKGAIIANNKEEALQAVDLIMRKRAFGAAGDRVVIEEYLDGPEATFMFFVDGETCVPMSAAQDYKRAGDGDLGLNTGGMGSYSPVPALTDELQSVVIETITKPTLKALKAKGICFKGVMYCGLALTSAGPKVIEFNARFGDPETQVVLPLLQSDLAEICYAAATGNLDSQAVSWYNKKALCVIMASAGYPGDYEKGKVIEGIDEAEKTGTIVFHAGTERDGDRVVTSGGRVLAVTAVADSFRQCIDKAYEGVGKIGFDGAYFRRDIGARLL